MVELRAEALKHYKMYEAASANTERAVESAAQLTIEKQALEQSLSVLSDRLSRTTTSEDDILGHVEKLAVAIRTQAERAASLAVPAVSKAVAASGTAIANAAPTFVVDAYVSGLVHIRHALGTTAPQLTGKVWGAVSTSTRPIVDAAVEHAAQFRPAMDAAVLKVRKTKTPSCRCVPVFLSCLQRQ